MMSSFKSLLRFVLILWLINGLLILPTPILGKSVSAQTQCTCEENLEETEEILNSRPSNEARTEVIESLDVVQNSQLNFIQDSVPFIKLSEVEKQNQTQIPQINFNSDNKRGNKKWYIIGGTALVIIIAAILFFPQQKEKTIADPPERP